MLLPRHLARTAHLIALLYCVNLHAHETIAIINLGVIDQTHEVLEADPRELRSMVDFGEQVKSWLEKLPGENLSPSITTTNLVWSPNYTVPDNIHDAEGNLLYLKGTVVKPLDIYKPKGKLLFFDNSTAQLIFAQSFINKHPNVKPILTQGNLAEVKKRFPKQVYYAYPYLYQTFHIKHLPALVGYFPDISSTNMLTIFFPIKEPLKKAP